MYECFNCGARAVYWLADYDSEDYGYDTKSIVHICHCNNCGADITYVVPIEESTNKDKELHSDDKQ